MKNTINIESAIEDYIDSFIAFMLAKSNYESAYHKKLNVIKIKTKIKNQSNKYPGNLSIKQNLHILEVREKDIQFNLENARYEYDFLTKLHRAEVESAIKAGIVTKTGKEWYEVELA